MSFECSLCLTSTSYQNKVQGFVVRELLTNSPSVQVINSYSWRLRAEGGVHKSLLLLTHISSPLLEILEELMAYHLSVASMSSLIQQSVTIYISNESLLPKIDRISAVDITGVLSLSQAKRTKVCLIQSAIHLLCPLIKVDNPAEKSRTIDTKSNQKESERESYTVLNKVKGVDLVFPERK